MDNFRLFSTAMAVLVVVLVGCKQPTVATTPSFLDQSPAVHQKRLSACVDAANANMPKPISSTLETKITAYCNCFEVKGLAQFTPQEVAAMDQSTGALQDPVIQAKMTKAQTACREEVFHN